MVRTTTLVTLFALGAGGCFLDGARASERPARARFSLNTRALEKQEQGRPIARSTLPPASQPEEVPTSATTGALAFTMAAPLHTYFGAEAEAGTLGWSGSNFAAAYGLAGLETSNDLGALSFELAAGRRWLRYDLNGTNPPAAWVIEPRLVGQIWISPHVTFGADVGIDGDDAWLTGVFLAVHSSLFNSGAR